MVGEVDAAFMRSSSCLHSMWLEHKPVGNAHLSMSLHVAREGVQRRTAAEEHLLMVMAAISPESSRLRARLFSLALWGLCSLPGEVLPLLGDTDEPLLLGLGVANRESSTSLPLLMR